MRHRAPQSRYALLFVMALMLGVNLFDSYLLSILLEPIKRDLQLSDTQLGFVTGLGTQLLTLALALPIARWADRSDRLTIAALAMSVWAMTGMAMVLVGSFIQLVMARLLASFGDAGVDPPLRSLVGDLFPNVRERTRAMFILAASGPFANFVAFTAAGHLNNHFGWRLTFIFASLPGIVLAIVLRTMFRDPRPMSEVPREEQESRGPSLRDVFQTIWRLKTCRLLVIAASLFCIMGQGLSPWYGALLIRAHGVDVAQVGVWLGLIFGIGGAVGLLAGTLSYERWFGRSASLQLRAASAAGFIAYPFVLGFILAPTAALSLGSLAISAVLLPLILPPMNSQLQRVVPDNMRASANALIFTIANFVGIGLGPQVVGIFSDLFTNHGVELGLRYAMAMVSLCAVPAAAALYFASKTVAAEERRIES